MSRDITLLHGLGPHIRCWGQKPVDEQELMLTQVLDNAKNPRDHIAMVDSCILTRSDFWSLGLERDVEGTILNCCLKIIEKKVDHVFAASSYVTATWFPPNAANPMDHLPVICH
ncbi:hypothetical protein OJAV_G00235440 [Oryzias javanicus]|uniref:Uncharacterized protein n=1 Tax=Oryzias javanicus TaxID=123683 RepID=A0A3S2NSX1_ORYJA|nr:hypothetical protein OJAV_G00235440 [Oryzias javanicus]